MRIIATGFNELKAACLVKGTERFVFVDHQKAHFGASVGCGAVAAVCYECLADAAVLAGGEDCKALEDIRFFAVSKILLKLNASNELSVNPRSIEVCSICLFGKQLLKR